MTGCRKDMIFGSGITPSPLDDIFKTAMFDVRLNRQPSRSETQLALDVLSILEGFQEHPLRTDWAPIGADRPFDRAQPLYRYTPIVSYPGKARSQAEVIRVNIATSVLWMNMSVR